MTTPEISLAFNGIIIDPDSGSRTRLKSATTTLKEFDYVVPCATLREARKWTDRLERVDLIFVSERLEFSAAQKFVSDAKALSNCINTIFVLIKNANTGGLSPQDALTLGADGILCEPFSIDSLMQVVALAVRLGQEREEVRQRLSNTLLVADILNQIDATAYLLKDGYHPKALIKSLRMLGDRTRSIPEQHRESFYEILQRLSSKTKPMEKKLATKIYRGASERVRKLTEKKLWHEIATIQKLHEDK